MCDPNTKINQIKILTRLHKFKTSDITHKFIQAKCFNPKHPAYQSCTHSHGYIGDKLEFSVFDMQTGGARARSTNLPAVIWPPLPHNKKFLGLSSPEVFVFPVSPGVCFFFFSCFYAISPKVQRHAC